jgi:hypothetical protein
MIAIVILALFLVSLMLVVAYAVVRANGETSYSRLLRDDEQTRQMIRNGQIDDASTRLHRLAARNNEQVQDLVASAIDGWRQAEQIIEQHPEITEDEMFYQALLTNDEEAARRRYLKLVGTRRDVHSRDVVQAFLMHRDFVYGHKERHPEESLSDAGIRDMLATGRFDEAVRAYQLFTGVDQFTAQDAVTERWQQLRLSGDTDADGSGMVDADNDEIEINADGELQRRNKANKP